MSEIKKNIETCRGEDVLAEVSGLPQDPHFGSLVNEALDPLKQQAAAQEGWDGYSEVIAQHKPYTFASAIIQMKSNLLLLLRALWLYPFGSGTLRSLSDMWQHYITRLSGNETYGIPSRLSSLTDIPSAPLLVSDRKISGVPDAADGISLLQLIGSAYDEVTELLDDTSGWAMPSTAKMNVILNAFPNVTKIVFGCSTATADFDQMAHALTEVEFPNLTYYKHTSASGHSQTLVRGNMEEVNFPVLETYVARDGGYGNGLVNDLPYCKKFSAPKLSSWPNQDSRYAAIGNCPNLEEVDFSSLVAPTLYATVYSTGFANCDKLICIKFKAYYSSCNMSQWNPDLSDNDVLAQFLSNFRTYIALRLADNGSGKTLTLSQAVYDAIKDESHLFVFDEGTMTIYAYLTNIKHWTVTK